LEAILNGVAALESTSECARDNEKNILVIIEITVFVTAIIT